MKITTGYKRHSLLTPFFLFLLTLTTYTLSATEIKEEQFITINGIEQWVTIKGDASKPVILFLHGGPGSTMSPYAHNVYKSWEKDFVLVQWDQRGAGKTYGKNGPKELTPEFLKANPLTVEQIANDGIALTEYLTKHLGKRKVILFGTSWGSVLGIHMASKRPDLFSAYVGHSQVVVPSANMPRCYGVVYEKAEKAKDAASLEILNTLGKPPYNSARKDGKLMRIIKKYESQASTPAPESWWTAASEYDNEKDAMDRENGDDYSFVNYAGDEKFNLVSMVGKIDYMRDNLDFKLPIYFIQGEEDILTPATITKPYFEKLKAPKKEYILLPKTAHGFNEAVVAAQYKIFMSIR
ncbi:alpha/beta hydrolase [Flavobacterium sp.]|uniref:alpha/beta hydrolase n=1 Tax=Flavobacterium sp. TaxID=239 RepID=UPI00263663A4|nr:alpha/beta hydrolase [Flavobacterium sp.]